MSMPINQKLIVKEHPWCVGKRNLSYYKKLFKYSGVYVCNPQLSAERLIKNSSLVVVISGTTGFEAVLHKKPVITFGSNIINLLPKTMVKNVPISDKLDNEINHILQNYFYEENAILRLLSSIYENSFSLKLYDVLLNKVGFFNTNSIDKDSELDKLGDNIINKFDNI